MLRNLLLVTVALVAACDKNPRPASSGDEAPTVSYEPIAPAGGTAEESVTDLTLVPMMTPTDAQILHILSTANAAEIDSGNLVLQRSMNPAARAFATQMIADHAAGKERTKVLAEMLAVTPEDNSTSKELQEAHDDLTDHLQQLEGAAFDRAYVDGAVAMHTEVLATIDEMLIPNAKSADLQQFLTETRPKISAHLDHAKRLQGTLVTSSETL